MRFLVLGPLEVVDDRGRSVPIAGAKERTILALLIARAGRVVPADDLIEALWRDEPPRTAERTLVSYVSRLRRELLVGDSPVAGTSERPIVPSGRDAADRLIHYLQEVLYLYDTERFVPAEAAPEGVRGEPFQEGRHQAVREVKAVTYHGLEVRRGEDGQLRANVVFDL